jgi:hypothetical protein
MKSHKTQSASRKVVLLLMGLLFCSGCNAGLKEGLRGFAGVSTKVLEDGLPGAATKEFNLSYAVVYSKAMDTLKQIKAYIYAIDNSRNLIAIYVSEEDTTPVGIFFKGIGKDRTQVQVSSPSSYAKGLISDKIFAGLDKLKP